MIFGGIAFSFALGVAIWQGRRVGVAGAIVACALSGWLGLKYNDGDMLTVGQLEKGPVYRTLCQHLEDPTSTGEKENHTIVVRKTLAGTPQCVMTDKEFPQDFRMENDEAVPFSPNSPDEKPE